MRTLCAVRLTNRGRVACGVLATAVALAGQSAYSALVSGPPAGAAARQVAAARPPTPLNVPASPSVPPGTAAPEPSAGSTSPVPVMDRDRDDLPPTSSPTATVPAETTAPAATTAPTAAPTARASAVPSGNARLSTVEGTSGVAGKGTLRRYRVQLEGGIGEKGAVFAAAVQRTLTDKRSWGAQWSFQRVDAGPVAFTVVLASPALAEQLCKPLEISYRLSCFAGGRSVINLARWRYGVDAYQGKLSAYRQYVINHEVGHALGHDHEPCRGAGQLAPAMMQQTKSVGACRPNPWPYPGA